MLNCRGNLKQCSVQSVLRDPFLDASETDYPVHFARVVGSCDGLFCVVINKHNLVLWNPSTKASKTLPDFGAERNYGSYLAYGLGYDKSRDDYKVVGFFNSTRGLSEFVVKIYCLKSDEWKNLENFKGRWLMDDPATFADGKLHWLSSRDSGGSWDIVFLHLESEEYGIMHLPSHVKSDYFYSRLGAHQESLFVLYSHDTCAHVWIMDAAGKGIWTKVVTIPYIDDFLRYTYKTALYLLENGEVLLHCNLKFVIFNPRDGSFRYHEVRNSDGIVTATTYIESLVSPIA